MSSILVGLIFTNLKVDHNEGKGWGEMVFLVCEPCLFLLF